MSAQMTILLVEDNDLDVELFKRGLKRCGMSNRLLTARDGLEALALLERNLEGQTVPHPYVVLLDINMPGMNGHEFLHALRARERLRGVRVFVFTTSANKRDVDLAYEHNICGYVVKPNSSAELREILQRLRNFWEICENPSAPQHKSA